MSIVFILVRLYNNTYLIRAASFRVDVRGDTELW